VSKKRSKAEDELDGDEELSLSALLDYMGCDDWLVQAFLGMESGRDFFLDSTAKKIYTIICSKSKTTL
jgi:hypothetical protein